MPIRENHLNYLPLHMSFGLIRDLNIDRIAQEQQAQYRIKPGFTWSEDHFGIEKRIFSNSQSMLYTLQHEDLKRVGDSVAISVRCLAKQDIPEDHLATLKQNSHQFSLVATFTELTKNIAASELYEQMSVNNEVRIIATGDITGDAEIDL